MRNERKKEGNGDYEAYPNGWIPVGLVCALPCSTLYSSSQESVVSGNGRMCGGMMGVKYLCVFGGRGPILLYIRVGLAAEPSREGSAVGLVLD